MKQTVANTSLENINVLPQRCRDVLQSIIRKSETLHGVLQERYGQFYERFLWSGLWVGLCRVLLDCGGTGAGWAGNQWAHSGCMGRRAGLPASLPPAITASLYKAAADAEIIAEGGDFFFSKKGACHGHGVTQIRTPRTMRIDYEVRRGKLFVNTAVVWFNIVWTGSYWD